MNYFNEEIEKKILIKKLKFLHFFAKIARKLPAMPGRENDEISNILLDRKKDSTTHLSR